MDGEMLTFFSMCCSATWSTHISNRLIHIFFFTQVLPFLKTYSLDAIFEHIFGTTWKWWRRAELVFIGLVSPIEVFLRELVSEHLKIKFIHFVNCLDGWSGQLAEEELFFTYLILFWEAVFIRMQSSIQFALKKIVTTKKYYFLLFFLQVF